MEVKEHEGRGKAQGFTLVELLLAIVVVGVLTSVAIVGTGAVVDKGSAGSCRATADSARAATAIYYTNSNQSTFPSDFFQLTSPQKTLAIDSRVTPNPTSTPALAPGDTVLTGSGWTLTMSGGGATEPSFACAS